MRIIATITDKDLGLPFAEWSEETRRDAARAVLRHEGRIALLHVTKRHHHKLPGGGVEEGESVEEALERELLEETGYACRIIGEIGITVEHRLKQRRTQQSYCYLADATQRIGEPVLTPEESAEGYKLIWVTIDEAIATLQQDPVSDYVGYFVRYRDLRILEAARGMI